jgi:hypothetical protein
MFELATCSLPPPFNNLLVAGYVSLPKSLYVLKKYKLPVEYFPLYQRMYDVAVKWPELHDVPGPWPYTLKGFISKAGSEHNWKQRQANK